MKKISVLIPCYNEEENVLPMSQEIVDLFHRELPSYDYELVFIDNDSTDATKLRLRKICEGNRRIKAIFNAKNFGQNNSPIYGMCQTTGSCTIAMACDFQDPIQMIPQYIKAWEEGYKIVVGVKKVSRENRLLFLLRSFYYKLLKKMSNIDLIEHFTGAGLYDKCFVDILRSLDDSTPFLRGLVAEFGYGIKTIAYEQPKRRAGKTHNNFGSLYDLAMLSFTTYTKGGIRLATFLGIILGGLSFITGVIYLILKLLYWDSFDTGMAPVLIGVFFLGSIQIFLLGLLGEYIANINTRVMHRPLVIENERINFDK